MSSLIDSFKNAWSEVFVPASVGKSRETQKKRVAAHTRLETARKNLDQIKSQLQQLGLNPDNPSWNAAKTDLRDAAKQQLATALETTYPLAQKEYADALGDYNQLGITQKNATWEAKDAW